MTRSYSMRGVQGTALRAVSYVTRHLRQVDPQSRVHDLQEDPRFQHRGVDLLWERSNGEVLGIEVKGDRQGRRKSYFFELISNFEKNTPGCFLYSRADTYAYVFLDTLELHLLPLQATREWFLAHAKEFPNKHVQTKTGPIVYTTVGASVPVSRVKKAVLGLEIIKLKTSPQAAEPAPTTGQRTGSLR